MHLGSSDVLWETLNRDLPPPISEDEVEDAIAKEGGHYKGRRIAIRS